MTFDPRWLEILKASGWQTTAIAIACALFLWVNQSQWIPLLDPWMIQFAVAALLISGLLALSTVATKLVEFAKEIYDIIQESRALRHSIDTLNADEIAFLKEQVVKGETTIHLHPFNAGSIRQFVHQAGIFSGLADKGIVTRIAADPEGKIQTITIEKAAWDLLKGKFK